MWRVSPGYSRDVSLLLPRTKGDRERDIRECVALFSVLSLEKPKTSCAHVLGPTHAQPTRASVRCMRVAGVIPMRQVVLAAFEFHAVRTTMHRSPRIVQRGVLFNEKPFTHRAAFRVSPASPLLANLPSESGDLT